MGTHTFGFFLNRIVEKLILHLFLFYGNGRLKQFCSLNYGIFQKL
ncbi:hypothetical protein LEP1GSC124_3895 [Leptospira interrogans serovar Pyrogenes str. 200701872]|uniref:Uncharacterized protein n=1 Tax=Leptospira interrogans serovar Pyrogenes str. 200701872 TaxID=1193029 RepID=M7A7C8_LEPIR|nr:hypothetical protein LEP1GSC124_3895 [Leptospira interrogans serovar Pyrogenes str. 200701872]